MCLVIKRYLPKEVCLRVNLWDIGVCGREARAMVKLNVSILLAQ